MLTRKERKEITILNGIQPDFKKIAKYYNDTNEDQFYNHYQYFKKMGFDDAFKVIKKYKLELHKSDLIYFLVEYGRSLEFNIWAKEVSLAKVHQKEAKQKIKLLEFFSKIITQNNHEQHKHSESIKFPAIKKIKFITDKNIHLEIDSYPLCYDIINLLEAKYISQREDVNLFLSKKVNINPRKYERDFILSLKPLINYIKQETIGDRSANEIYEFIIEFLETLSYDINLSVDRIKDALKPSNNTGRNPH